VAGPATNLDAMENEATKNPAGDASSTGPGAPQADWPAKVADTIEDVVDTVGDRVIRPLILAARGLVFGVIIVTMALVLAVVVAIAVVRLLDVYAFGGRVWASDALLGALLVIGGAFAWSKRTARGAEEG
jgi:hypothetical protein